MMLRSATMLSATVSVPGCGGMIMYDGSRNQSRDVIGRAMADRNPDLNSDDAAACLVSGLSVQDVVMLGVSDMRTGTAKTRTNLEEVLQRPVVAACGASLPRTEPVQ
jgi:hypothetical protein